MAAVTYDFPAFEPHMRKPLTFSVAFHLVIVLVAVLGLPYLKPALPIIDDTITVELVDADQISKEEKPEPAHKPKPPEQKKEEPPKPVMPTVTAKTPPKPTAPAPPEKNEFAIPDKDTPEPLPKPTPAKPKTPPKPLKRPILTKPDEKPQEEEFKSLLRNLMPNEQQAVQSDKPDAKDKTPVPVPYAQSMSPGELAGLKAQLSQCWRVMAGARYAEDLVVDLKLTMNPDRTVRDVKVLNQMRYNTDSFFRAAADSAVSAVYRCKQLDLPPNKYDVWDTITVTFDPRTML